ncbi:activating transcription factor 3 [Anopheles bellator]|uniref:activating transcription factor 3 n=1 Tax=Anopheles bellator TaxID=139047 RepID=UPI002648BA60|nr:activating transcription factor 3 [Anopheles bellator]
MFNTNLTLTVPSLLVMDGGTPRTPEILNSLMAMTSPLEYSYPVNTSQTSLNDSHSNSSDSPLDSPASQHHPHHQQQSHQQLYHHQTRKTPSVQQTRSQLIKEGVKLLIQNKRKHSGGDSSDGNESSTPMAKVSRRREPSGTDQRETSDDDMDSKSSPRSAVALTPEDEDRRRRRRERNKIAATKCRMKKRERTVNLINESETLDAQNKELKSQVSKLESERRKLLEVLQAHGPKCVHQKGYQPLPALSSITAGSNRNLNDLGYLDPNAGVEQGAAEIKYSECLKSASTGTGGSALENFAKQDPDGVLLPPGYCKLSPTEPNSFLLETGTAELPTPSEANGTGFLARGQKSTYASVSSPSSSSTTSSTTVNQTTGKSSNGRAKPGPKPRQSRGQSSAVPKAASATVSTPVTTNATSLSSLPYVSKGGNPLMTASLMATTPSSSPASLPSPVTISSSCSSVSVSNPILTLTAAAHDTDFMLKNELIDTSSPYTTVQSADRFLFDATLDLYNNNAHSPLTAGLNCGSTPQQQQQQQQNHLLAQNNVTLNNNNPNLVNENDRLNHLSAIKDNTSNTLLEFGVSFDALKPATVNYQQQHQASNDMTHHHHHHHHPQQQLHGATMLGGDPTLSHLLHQQQHQNHQQQQHHQHQHQQHLLQQQQQHQLQLQQLQQQHQQHQQQQQLVNNALDLLCPVANEFLLLPDEDPSEFTDLDSGITAYNSINGCLA